MLFCGAGGRFFYLSEAKQFNKNGCDGNHQLYQFTQKKQGGYEKLHKLAEKKLQAGSRYNVIWSSTKDILFKHTFWEGEGYRV